MSQQQPIPEGKHYYSDIIFSEQDKEWGASLMDYPLGNGDNVGDYNVTIVRLSGTAKLRLIKSNGPGQPATVITEINLSTHTGRIKVDGGNIIVETVGAGHLHNNTVFEIGFSSKADLKITPHCPMLPDPYTNGLAIVGVEDARDGVYDGRGDHHLYALTEEKSNIRISQGSYSTLRISRYTETNTKYFFKSDEYYCDPITKESTSGVKHWGKDFQKSCED